MKRRNVQDAFIGESTGAEAHDTGELPALEEMDDAVEFEVSSGTLMVVVPHATPDNEVFDNYHRIGVNLTLEDGTVYSISIEEGSVGVTVSYRGPDAPRADEHTGHSSIENIPGAV
jgi:hypothetical protein